MELLAFIFEQPSYVLSQHYSLPTGLNFSNHDRSVFIQVFLISRTFCDVIDVGRLRCSTITFLYLLSYHEYHLCIAVLFIAASPYALTNISSFFSVFFFIENTEFNRCSLFDAHFDAPCINKMAANAQMTSYVNVTSLTSCQDLVPYCAKV